MEFAATDRFRGGRRGRASGPSTTIATNVTGTTYSNGGLTTGRRNYYVVSAVNTGGESPNSNPATAVSN